MTEPETYCGPLYVPYIDAGRGMITTEQAARSLAEPGFPINKASVFWRNLALAGMIHPYSRQKTGKKAYYYKPDQVVIAAILHRMKQAGIDGEEQRRATALALNSWREEDIGEGVNPSFRTPAMWALVEYINGERDFAFHLMAQCCPNTGDVFHTARVTNAAGGGSSFILQDGWENRSVFAIDLDLLLAQLTRSREVAN